MMFVSLGTAMGQWKEGKVKMLAIGARKRLAALPEMPTVAESGLPGYEAVSWFGLFGPAGMPPDVVAKLNAEVRRILADAEVNRTIIAPQFFESIAGTPEQLADYLKSEGEKWGKVIRDAKIKVE
jgi:tripartite-type tricarboxylate transporter receptor subunit TctC